MFFYLLELGSVHKRRLQFGRSWARTEWWNTFNTDICRKSKWNNTCEVWSHLYQILVASSYSRLKIDLTSKLHNFCFGYVSWKKPPCETYFHGFQKLPKYDKNVFRLSFLRLILFLWNLPTAKTIDMTRGAPGGGGGGAHKEMRAKNFPFPYEDGPRAVMGVKCLVKCLLELDTLSRICNHFPISSKWPFL